MTSPTYRPLTDAERTALETYAAKYGRAWKARLNEDWYHARLTGVLHSLRNTHGPSGLASFKLDR